MNLPYLLKPIFFSLFLLMFLVSRSQTDSLKPKVPFDGMDLTWLNGSNRQSEFPLTFEKNKQTLLTAGIYVDAYYNYNFADPVDHTQTISSTLGRHREFTLNLMSLSLETSYKNIIGRVAMQYGQMASIIQETDASVKRGRNTSVNNLKYVREAVAGYHFNRGYGVNLEMGILLSYIGLESYITQENWNYQRSLVSEFTPFYFSGARAQFFPGRRWKQELWIVNGWQSYHGFSKSPGLGSFTLFRPNQNVQLSLGFYGGMDTGNPDTLGHSSGRKRFHHDNTLMWRYCHKPKSKRVSGAAFSLNSHYGFQYNRSSGDELKSSDNFMSGCSLAHRIWFRENKTALTLRGDYLVNQSTVNGKNVQPYLAYEPAVSTKVPNNYETALAEGQKLKLLQLTTTLDLMPGDHFTLRLEYCYRKSSIPYFAGRGGTTSASGWIDGPLPVQPWTAHLSRSENRVTLALNVRI